MTGASTSQPKSRTAHARAPSHSGTRTQRAGFDRSGSRRASQGPALAKSAARPLVWRARSHVRDLSARWAQRERGPSWGGLGLLQLVTSTERRRSCSTVSAHKPRWPPGAGVRRAKCVGSRAHASGAATPLGSAAPQQPQNRALMQPTQRTRGVQSLRRGRRRAPARHRRVDARQAADTIVALQWRPAVAAPHCREPSCAHGTQRLHCSRAHSRAHALAPAALRCFAVPSGAAYGSACQCCARSCSGGRQAAHLQVPLALCLAVPTRLLTCTPARICLALRRVDSAAAASAPCGIAVTTCHDTATGGGGATAQQRTHLRAPAGSGQ